MFTFKNSQIYFYLFILTMQVLVVARGRLVAKCGIGDLQLLHVGFQFLDQGSDSGLLHWELRVLAIGSPGKSFHVCGVFSLRWVFVVTGRLSLVAVCGLLLVVASRVVKHGFQEVWTQQLWCRSLVSPRHVGSSQIGDQTYIPCIGRQILNYWTTKKVLCYFLNEITFTSLDLTQQQPT